MKIIKVMLKKNRTVNEKGEGQTEFRYPAMWDAQKINVVVYQDTEELGEIEEYCIGLIHDDAYAKQLIASTDAVEEIDEATANKLGEPYRPPTLMLDQALLPQILVAINKPIRERTTDELNMLDPNHPDAGIRTSEKFNVRNWFPK